MYNIIHNRSVFTHRHTARSSGNFQHNSKVFLVHAMMSTGKGYGVGGRGKDIAVLIWNLKRLRWSRGSVLEFGTQVREFAPVRSRSFPSGKTWYPLCTGGWVGPRAGLDQVRKTSPPAGFDPRTVQLQPFAIRTELPGPREKAYLYVIFYRFIWLFFEIVRDGFAQGIVLSLHLFKTKQFVATVITHTTDVRLHFASYFACSLFNDTHCIRPLASND